MTTQTPQIFNTVSSGSASTQVFLTYFSNRAPTPQDTNWFVGQRWVNSSIDPVIEYLLVGFMPMSGYITANWQELGSNTTDIRTLTGNTGGPVGSDIAGNVNVIGDGTSITIAGDPGTNTLTASLVGSPGLPAIQTINTIGPTTGGDFEIEAGTGIAITPGTNSITISLTGGGEAIDSIEVDAFTAPGTNPVVPNGAGLVTVTGGQVAAGTTVNVIRTNSLAANTYTVEIQRASAVASSTLADNGVAHFNSATSSIDSNGFMSPFQLAKWIVNPTTGLGTHTTITAALAAASSGDIVLVTQGTYTENFTLPSGVTLTGMPGASNTPAVIISGEITFTAAGSASINNVQMQTNSNFFLSVTGSNECILTIDDCVMLCTNNSGINYTNSNSNSQINIYNSFGDVQTTGVNFYTMTGDTILYVNSSQITNSGGTSTQSTNTDGLVNVRASQVNVPIYSSASGGILATNSQFNIGDALTIQAIQIDGTAQESNITNCRIVAGNGTSAPLVCNGLVNIYVSNVAGNNADWVSGTGTVRYAGVSTLAAVIGGGITATPSNFFIGTSH